MAWFSIFEKCNNSFIYLEDTDFMSALALRPLWRGATSPCATTELYLRKCCRRSDKIGSPRHNTR